MDDESFPLSVMGYIFDCFYQRGFLTGVNWRKSLDGDTHAAVCKCGRGVFGSSIDDAVEKLRQSYSILRTTEHFHWQDTIDFNVILGFDSTWIMGTIRHPELLGNLGIENPSGEEES